MLLADAVSKNKVIIILLLLLSVAALTLFSARHVLRQEEVFLKYDQNTKALRQTPNENKLSPIQSLARCIFSASSAYGVPADVLVGIMHVEGGHIGQAAGPNVNGTFDLGIMQVNSLWVPQLARLWHVDYQTAYKAIRDNGCGNIFVGTWILKQNIVKTGTLYNGVANYHSATPGLGSAYANKVIVTMKEKGLVFPR